MIGGSERGFLRVCELERNRDEKRLHRMFCGTGLLA